MVLCDLSVLVVNSSLRNLRNLRIGSSRDRVKLDGASGFLSGGRSCCPRLRSYETMSITNELAALFSRDLAKLSKQTDAFPTDELLWQTLPGVINSAGNLALHIEGNLSEFVGRQLGGLPYQRNRDLEFSSKAGTRAELSTRLAKLRESIPAVIEDLKADELEQEYPQVVLDRPMSTGEFLIHLYGHLNWHLGQVDYLRRLLTPQA